MKIVLIGYMGSGKSTIGKNLSEITGLKFIDLDDYIENSEKKTIPEIFRQSGEIYFRKKEFECLNGILNNENDFILSTGGGTPCYGRNMQTILEATANVFYLNVPISELVERLAKEKQHRPLIAKFPDEELPEFIGKHLFERSFYYNKAHHTLFSKEKNVSTLVNEIREKLI